MLVLTGPSLLCSRLRKCNIKSERIGASVASSATCACGAVTARNPSANTVDNAKRLIVKLLTMLATVHHIVY